MSTWLRKSSRSAGKNQSGQSLLETALAMPLLLGLAFNIVNFGYMWFMVLTLSASPRIGAQYATQGGAAGTSTPPSTTLVSNLVYENLTHAISGATTSNVGVQVCSNAKGVNATSNVALCDQFGAAFPFPTPPPDPEAPVFVLDRVDVEYTLKPIIPGTVFNIILPANLTCHRQVSMRSLY